VLSTSPLGSIPTRASKTSVDIQSFQIILKPNL
jgi:hypothetical protein